VVAIDRDAERLAAGRTRAVEGRLSIDWRELDLEGPWPRLGLLMRFGIQLS